MNIKNINNFELKKYILFKFNKSNPNKFQKALQYEFKF